MSCADDWWDTQADDYQADEDPDEAEPYRLITDVIRDLADYQPA